jgi:hypothetical protein
MRAATFLLAIFVIAAIAYCAYYYRIELGLVRPPNPPLIQSATPPPMESQSGQPTGPPRTWQTIDRPADGFHVDMPAGAVQAQAPAYTAKGGIEQVEMLQATPSPETTFAVSWAENPPVERASREDSDRTLDLAINGALARTRTVLIAESRSTFAGYQARDFAARGNQGVMNARLILAGKRLFMLVATFPSQSAQNDGDVNHFFNSFSVTEPSCRN